MIQVGKGKAWEQGKTNIQCAGSLRTYICSEFAKNWTLAEEFNQCKPQLSS